MRLVRRFPGTMLVFSTNICLFSVHQSSRVPPLRAHHLPALEHILAFLQRRARAPARLQHARVRADRRAQRRRMEPRAGHPLLVAPLAQCAARCAGRNPRRGPLGRRAALGAGRGAVFPALRARDAHGRRQVRRGAAIWLAGCAPKVRGLSSV